MKGEYLIMLLVAMSMLVAIISGIKVLVHRRTNGFVFGCMHQKIKKKNGNIFVI